MIVPTPQDKLCDQRGRPYFLWDSELTLEEFRAKLREAGPERDYWLATLLRQAKPDDALTFVDLAAVREAWPRIGARLGKARAFWGWRLAKDEAA